MHANSTNTAGADPDAGRAQGYELDLFVQHGDTLWPCVSATGPLATNNLHISSYSTAVAYTVEATYTQNRIGEWYFSCAGRKDAAAAGAGSVDAAEDRPGCEPARAREPSNHGSSADSTTPLLPRLPPMMFRYP